MYRVMLVDMVNEVINIYTPTGSNNISLNNSSLAPYIMYSTPINGLLPHLFTILFFDLHVDFLTIFRNILVGRGYLAR